MYILNISGMHYHIYYTKKFEFLTNFEYSINLEEKIITFSQLDLKVAIQSIFFSSSKQGFFCK